MKKNININKMKYLLLILPLFLVILFFEIVPLIGIIVKSFFEEGTTTLSLSNYINIFSREYFLISIKNSFVISLISAFIGIIIAFLCSVAIRDSKNSKVSKTFINILNITSNFQGIQLAFAFIIILGNSGTFVLMGKKFGINWLGNFDLYTSFGLILTFVFFQIPLGTLLLYPSLKKIKKEYIEAAELINVTGIRFWKNIGIPILFPNIMGTFSVLFANALSAYATPYALMQNNCSLLPIRISAMFTGDVISQKELGSALSIVMIAIIVIVTIICNLISSRNNVTSSRASVISKKK